MHLSESQSDPKSPTTDGSLNMSYAMFKYPVENVNPLELRNRTFNNEGRPKRQFSAIAIAAARYIPSFLIKTIGPVFSSLLSNGKSHVASKWAKRLVPHTPLADTDAHDSICHHISKKNCHQIMDVLKSHSKNWDVKKVYPELEHPEERSCHRNIPIFDKVLQQRLSTATLASNTLVNTLIYHLSETLTLKIQKAAEKLDYISEGSDKVTSFLETAMASYERYILYTALGVLGIMLIGVLVWCWRLENALLDLASHLDQKDTKLTNLLTRTIQAQGKKVQEAINRGQELHRGKTARQSVRPISHAIEFENTSV